MTADSPAPEQTAPVPAGIARRCFDLFRVFASISAVALGGGLVMLPVMQREFVERRKWLSDQDMLDTVALMQSLPGIIAVNMSTLIGHRIAGIPGVLAATFGVVLPPFLTIVVIAVCLFNFLDNTIVQHVFQGIRAAVCAMILVSACKMARKTLTGSFEITVAVCGFAALLFFNANIFLLIGAAALAGIIHAAVALRRQKAADKGERP